MNLEPMGHSQITTANEVLADSAQGHAVHRGGLDRFGRAQAADLFSWTPERIAQAKESNRIWREWLMTAEGNEYLKKLTP